MARRKKLISNWPPSGWDVKYDIEVNGTTITSRKHDVLVQAAPGKSKVWVFFDYFVTNTNNGKSWVSGFDECGFTAFRIEHILKARPHKEKKKSSNDELAGLGEVKEKRRRKTKKS